MNNLKFRAIEIYKNVTGLHYSEDYASLSKFFALVEKKGLNVDRCTHRKDINNKDIYENDLVVMLALDSKYGWNDSKYSPKIKYKDLIIEKEEKNQYRWYSPTWEPIHITYDPKGACFQLGNLTTSLEGFSVGRKLSFRGKTFKILGNIHEYKKS